MTLLIPSFTDWNDPAIFPLEKTDFLIIFLVYNDSYENGMG